MLKPELNEPVGANAPLLLIHTATVVANHEGEDETGSRSMTVGRYEEIRRRLDEGRGGHETFMRELRSGFAIAQRQALTKEAKAERLAPRLTQEQARVQERQAHQQSRLRGGKQGCLDVFDGLVGTHWRGRHEVSAGTCQGFTNR
jgi:hypothetical protein